MKAIRAIHQYGEEDRYFISKELAMKWLNKRHDKYNYVLRPIVIKESL